MRAIVVRCVRSTVPLIGVLLTFVSTAGAVEGKPFGISKFTLQPTEFTREEPLGGTFYEFVNEPYGLPFTEAGGHPWGLTATIEFATETSVKNGIVPTRDVKDVVTNLPPGLL